MLHIHALNINGKGATVALNSFLREMIINQKRCIVHLPLTYEISPLLNKENFVEYRMYRYPFIAKILMLFFAKFFTNNSLLLVFGDIPVLFCRHQLFSQNALLFDKRFNTTKIHLMRLLFRLGRRWVDRAYVQSEHMRDFLNLEGINDIVLVQHPSGRVVKNKTSQRVPFFLFLTSAYAHKNNNILSTLQKDLKDRVLVTLDSSELDFPEYLTCLGPIQPKTVAEFYRYSPILLITSECESYCLPIVEANEHGLRLVCPISDYTRSLSRPGVFLYQQNDLKSLENAMRKSLCFEGTILENKYSWKSLIDGVSL